MSNKRDDSDAPPGVFRWRPHLSLERIDETRCRASVPRDRVGTYQCTRKPVPGTEWCKQHSGKPHHVSDAPPVWLVGIDYDDKGDIVVRVEAIEVKWENNDKIMLTRRPSYIFSGSMTRTKAYAHRTREEALKAFVKEQEEERASLLRKINDSHAAQQAAELLRRNPDANSATSTNVRHPVKKRTKKT